MKLHACVICFLRKHGTLIGLKTLTTEIHNSTIYEEGTPGNRPTCTSAANRTW